MEIKLTKVLLYSRKTLIINIMKIFIFLFCSTIFGFTSGNLFSQNAKIFIEADKTVTVDEVFNILKQQTNYTFIYHVDLFKNAPNVQLKKGVIKANELLQKSLSEEHFNFDFINNNTIVINQKAVAINSSVTVQQLVKGKVVDQNGTGIPGANVTIKGTSKGTATDMDGNFSIEVPNNNAILVITFLGMQQKEVSATISPLVIILEDEDTLLEQVVVVGYTRIKQQNLTGSTASVNNKELNDATSPSTTNLLQGKAPGVYVNPGSGQPGEVGKIIIRGKTTINGSTDPLWVVDGVIVGTTSNVNPSDIETITVLKDAASTAVFGSQGANGVVLVTTKKGQLGKAKINFTTRVASTSLNMGNLSMMDGAEMYDYFDTFPNKANFSNLWWWTPELRDQNFDWADNATGNGLATDHNLSISGGNETLNSYVSLGYYDESAAVKGYDFTRLNLVLKFDYKVNKWLTIKPQVTASKGKIFNQQHSIAAIYLNLPWDSPYRPDGSLVDLKPNPEWVNSNSDNYLYNLQWNYSESEAYTFRSNLDFDIKITDYLTFSSINNYILESSNSFEYTDPRSSGGLSVGGRLRNSDIEINRVYTNQLLRFNKTIDKHDLNAVLGYEWNEFESSIKSSSATGFAPGFTVADVATKAESVKEGKSEWAVQSILSNFNYSYDKRILAQASFRRDGASNFGINERYGNFFSVSGGWNISNESFFKADYINNLKLRASYGSVGNRPGVNYGHLNLYSAAAGYDGNPGALLSQLGSDNLTWETSYTTDIGFDIGILKRINLSVDFYDKNTSGLLYRVPLPSVTGVTGIWKNVGEVNNRGFEINFSADIIKNEDWKWTFNANLGVNKNKVNSLYDDQEQIIIPDGSGRGGSINKILTPGKDVDTWYLVEWAGVDPETGGPQWYETDANGERVITTNYARAAQSRVEMGSFTPDYFGGFSTSLNYKNFDFSAMFTYSVGGEIYNFTRQSIDSDGAIPSQVQMNLYGDWNRWEKPGDIATHPLADYQNSSLSNRPSSRYLEDASYLKIRTMTLGYNIDLKKYKISNFRLFITGENLYTFSSFSGVDPETVTGVAVNTYPQTRKITFGLNFTL